MPRYGDLPVRRPLRPPPRITEKPPPPAPKLVAQREMTGKTSKELKKLVNKIQVRQAMENLEIY